MTGTTAPRIAPRHNATPSALPEQNRAPSLADVRSGKSTLMTGHTGPAVTDLQSALNDAGARPPLAEDGQFGPKTRAAVEAYQQKLGLKVDGLAGEATLKALEGTFPPVRDGFESTGMSTRSNVTGSTMTKTAPISGPTPAGQGQMKAGTLQQQHPRANASAVSGGGRGATTTPAAGGLQTMSAEARRPIDEALGGKHGPQAQAAVQNLLDAPGFQRLDAAGQRQVLGLVNTKGGGGLLGAAAAGNGSAASTKAANAAAAASTIGSAQQALRLVESPAMRDASSAQRGKIVATFEVASFGREQLLGLAAPSGGGPSPLLAKDLAGGAMIDSLHAIAKGPLAPELEPQRKELLASTMDEVADPARRINQHNRGTCAATSTSYVLAKQHPAEYARLVAGVASPSGKVAMKSGDTLMRPTDAAARDDSKRSPSERILQSSMMDYANGAKGYRNTKQATNAEAGTASETTGARDANVANGKEVPSGLMAAEVSRLATGIYGTPHRSASPFKGSVLMPKDATPLAQVMRRMASGTVAEGEKLGLKMSDNDPFAALQKQGGNPTVVGLKWGKSGHAVVVEKIEAGRVYFRNPWGAQPEIKRGASLENPPRRMEDPERGVQSMTTAEFKQRLISVVVPG